MRRCIPSSVSTVYRGSKGVRSCRCYGTQDVNVFLGYLLCLTIFAADVPVLVVCSEGKEEGTHKTYPFLATPWQDFSITAQCITQWTENKYLSDMLIATHKLAININIIHHASFRQELQYLTWATAS